MSMPDETGRGGGWLGRLTWLALIAAVAGAAAMAVAGPGFQQKWWDLAFAFRTLMAYGGWAVLGAGVAGLVLTIVILIRGPARLLVPSVLTLLISGYVLSQTVPLLLASGARPQLSKLAGVTPVPPIHDITTDPNDPPLFEGAVKLRGLDWMTRNPPEYDPVQGEKQRAFEGYSDIQPVYFNASPEVIYDRALRIVRENGWLVITDNKEAGIIEAAETSRWFGFTDDVVIRIRKTEDGRTRVDMRSKSRIGTSDVGMNAERIRKFMAQLEEG